MVRTVPTVPPRLIDLDRGADIEGAVGGPVVPPVPELAGDRMPAPAAATADSPTIGCGRSLPGHP